MLDAADRKAPDPAPRGLWLGVGALASGAAAGFTTLCCAGPLAVGLAGVGAATLGARLEPWRPYLVTTTVLCLGLAWYRINRVPAPCCEDRACATLRGRRIQRTVFWVLAAVALVLSTSSYWLSWYTYLTL